MNKKIVVGILVVIIAILVAAAAFSVAKRMAQRTAVAADCRNFAETQVTVGEHTIAVALADDAAERHQGLSGCNSMPADKGMYFVFQEPNSTAFWMKDMHFPLDIIWIADGKVTGVVENAPAPSPDVDLKTLPQYASPGSVDAVLELNAGKAKEYGLERGTPVDLVK